MLPLDIFTRIIGVLPGHILLRISTRALLPKRAHLWFYFLRAIHIRKFVNIVRIRVLDLFNRLLLLKLLREAYWRRSGRFGREMMAFRLLELDIEELSVGWRVSLGYHLYLGVNTHIWNSRYLRVSYHIGVEHVIVAVIGLTLSHWIWRLQSEVSVAVALTWLYRFTNYHSRIYRHRLRWLNLVQLSPLELIDHHLPSRRLLLGLVRANLPLT